MKVQSTGTTPSSLELHPKGTESTPNPTPRTHSEELPTAPIGELEKLAEKMNKVAPIFNHALQFKVVDKNRIVVKVVDTVSGEVVREIPPEKLVEAVTRMEDSMGFLLDRKV